MSFLLRRAGYLGLARLMGLERPPGPRASGMCGSPPVAFLLLCAGGSQEDASCFLFTSWIAYMEKKMAWGCVCKNTFEMLWGSNVSVLFVRLHPGESSRRRGV